MQQKQILPQVLSFLVCKIGLTLLRHKSLWHHAWQGIWQRRRSVKVWGSFLAPGRSLLYFFIVSMDQYPIFLFIS